MVVSFADAAPPATGYARSPATCSPALRSCSSFFAACSTRLMFQVRLSPACCQEQESHYRAVHGEQPCETTQEREASQASTTQFRGQFLQCDRAQNGPIQYAPQATRSMEGGKHPTVD